MNNELQENQQEKEKKQQIRVHRIGKPEVIAIEALFLASDNASNVSGQQFMLMEE